MTKRLALIAVLLLAGCDTMPVPVDGGPPMADDAGVYPGCPDWAVGLMPPECTDPYACPTPLGDWTRCYEGDPRPVCMAFLPACPDGWEPVCARVEDDGTIRQGDAMCTPSAQWCEGADEGDRIGCPAQHTGLCVPASDTSICD